MHIPSNEDDELVMTKNNYRYAGFWMRFWAYLFDIIVLFGVNSFLLSPFKFIHNGMQVDIWFWTWNGIVAGLIYRSEERRVGKECRFCYWQFDDYNNGLYTHETL